MVYKFDSADPAGCATTLHCIPSCNRQLAWNTQDYLLACLLDGFPDSVTSTLNLNMSKSAKCIWIYLKSIPTTRWPVRQLHIPQDVTWNCWSMLFERCCLLAYAAKNPGSLNIMPCSKACRFPISPAPNKQITSCCSTSQLLLYWPDAISKANLSCII